MTVVNSKTKQTLQTVERALDVLEAIAESKQSRNNRALANALGLNITTVYHLVNTLSQRGYVHRDAAGGLNLGPAVSALFSRFRETRPFLQEVHQVLLGLSADTGETAWFSQLEGDHIVVRDLVEGSRALKVGGLYLGLSGNEYRRASGRAILPYLGEKERQAILHRATSGLDSLLQQAALTEFSAQSAQTLARGWSLDDQGSDEGIMSAGAPVFAPSGRVMGAVGVVGPESRMRPDLERRAEAITAAARTTARLLH